MPDASTSSVRLFHPLTDVQPSSASSATSGKVPQPAEGSHCSPGQDDKPLILIWPGYGVGARYYDPIARELSARGFAVATGELHGQGSSTAVASRKKSWGYHHTASQDYPLTVRAVKRELGLALDHPTIFLCHSMGGQIASLFMARPEARELGVRGFIGVGTGTPYYRGFEGKQRLRLMFGPKLMWLIVQAMGYQPDGLLDISGYGRQAKDHLQEWIRFTRTNRLYKLAGADIDYEERMKDVTAPIWLLRMSNDDDCPMQSARNLAVHLPRADVKVEQIDEPLGHNRWAREATIVTAITERFVSDLCHDVKDVRRAQ